MHLLQTAAPYCCCAAMHPPHPGRPALLRMHRLGASSPRVAAHIACIASPAPQVHDAQTVSKARGSRPASPARKAQVMRGKKGVGARTTRQPSPLCVTTPSTECLPEVFQAWSGTFTALSRLPQRYLTCGRALPRAGQWPSLVHSPLE